MVIDNVDDLEFFFNRNGGLGCYFLECVYGIIFIIIRNLQVVFRLIKGMVLFVIRIGKMDEVEIVQLFLIWFVEIDMMFGDYVGFFVWFEYLLLVLVQVVLFI